MLLTATRPPLTETPLYHSSLPPSPRSSRHYGSVRPNNSSSSQRSLNHQQHNRNTRVQPIHPNAPPPYPHMNRSSKRARFGVLDLAPLEQRAIEHQSSLSMEDIEQAFQVALNDQPEYYQLAPSPFSNEPARDVYLHPLKREAPPLRPVRNYGSISTAASTNVRTRHSSPRRSPVNRTPSPQYGNAPSGRPKSHRRVRSESPARQMSSRSFSDSLTQQRHGQMNMLSSSQRRRSLDAGPGTSMHSKQMMRQIFFPSPQQAPQHRRHASLQSSHGDSVRSDISLMSYRSDIRKSTYFEEFDTRTGRAKFTYPNSMVHLVMDEGRSLVYGHVYSVPVPANVYEEYFMALQEQEDGSFSFDYDLGNMKFCGCECIHCAACRGKIELPPRFYAISVRDDLYRHVVDEICLARSMPCGLFFCGHHSDVSRPSIFIAVVVVAILLTAMVIVALILAD